MRLVSSIKHQVLIVFVSLTLGFTLVLFALAVTTAFIVEDQVLDNWLSEQALFVEEQLAKNAINPASNLRDLKVYTSREQMPDWITDNLSPDSLSGEIFVPGREHYHYRQISLGDGNSGYLVAEVSGLLVVTKRPDIFATFLFAFVVFMMFSIWLSVRFSQHLVSPVIILTKAVAAREVSNVRSKLPEFSYELGYLSQTLQISFDRLHDALERERHFSTNVSHELRTPLTVIKNTCALISQRGYKPGDLAALEDSCGSMENTIDVLLALARAESLDFVDCKIKMQLEQALLRSRIVNLPGAVLHIHVAEEYQVHVNQRLLELLLTNLLNNFAEHASGPELRIELIENQLMFSNTSELSDGTDVLLAGVKRIESPGMGQGLYLVQRIAERFGWDLSVETTPGHFRVCLKLK